MKLLLRWLITALALAAAVKLVPGISIEGDNSWVVILVMAVSVGLINAIIRPILSLLTCPLIVLTLGLFTLVVNAVCLLIAAWVTTNIFGVAFIIDGFWPAFWGALIVSIISAVLSTFISDEKPGENRR